MSRSSAARKCGRERDRKTRADVAAHHRLPNISARLARYSASLIRPPSRSDCRCRSRPSTPPVSGGAAGRRTLSASDRKGVGKGKSVTVRVVLGGRRTVKKKKYQAMAGMQTAETRL